MKEKKEKKENKQNKQKNNPKKEQSLKKVDSSKEKKLNKRAEFASKFKKRWLMSGINTILLIAILIAVFVLINVGVKYIDPTAIDCTKSQDYTLTDESKERVKNIDKNINIYFVGFEDSDKDYTLAKQYNKANSKINVEIVDITKNLELANKYNLKSDSQTVIVESGDKSRTLEYSDLYTYDSSYNQVDIAEQKITSAILNVTTDDVPNVYFLTGYTTFSLNEKGYLSRFKSYLDNEVLTYEELNILSTRKVPDDCSTLIIMTPSKDFDDLTTNAIIDYINKGGNILWLNGVYEKDQELNNVNKILSQYGVEKFEKGVVYETNNSNTVLGYATCFIPTIESSDVLDTIKEDMGAVFFNPTKININKDKLSDLNVEETDLITSSDTTYFTTNLKSDFNSKKDTKGSFVLGAQLVKTISSDDKSSENNSSEEDSNTVKSKLMIYGDDWFISDQTVQSGQYQSYVVDLGNNADVALNSIAYLTNNDQDITIRKTYSDSETTFTPTDKEKLTIMYIIFVVPLVIIVIGIVVWLTRKHRV